MAYIGRVFSEKLGDILKIIFFLFAVRAIMLLAGLKYGNFPIVDPTLYLIWAYIGFGIEALQKAIGYKFF